MKKYAVGYIRETLYSHSRTGSRRDQEIAIRTYCAANGIELLEIFFDRSDAMPFQREGFTDMLRFVKEYEGVVDYLLIYKYVNLTGHAEEFLHCMIETDDLDLEIQVTHLKAFQMRKDSPDQAKWIELN